MKSIVLHSGGLDSTLLVHELIAGGKDVTSLYFDFGHNASTRELHAVKRTSALLDVRFEVIDMSTVRESFVSSSKSLLAVQPNPGKHVLALGGYLLIGPALTFAQRLGYREVNIGYTKNDADYAKEYGSGFLDAFQSTVREAGYTDLFLLAPFLAESKSKVLSMSKVSPEVLRASWSCVYSGKYHCGACQACHSRKAAFSAAHREDPTRYDQ